MTACINFNKANNNNIIDNIANGILPILSCNVSHAVFIAFAVVICIVNATPAPSPTVTAGIKAIIDAAKNAILIILITTFISDKNFFKSSAVDLILSLNAFNFSILLLISGILLIAAPVITASNKPPAIIFICLE